MNRKIVSLILICALVFGTAAMISGCGKKTATTTGSKPIKVTMTIKYPAKAKLANVLNIQFKLEKKAHVLDATELFCNVNNISLLVDTTKNIVEGISGVSNGDYNSKYVWKYKVNGTLCTENPLDKALKAGDSIEWDYVKK